MEDVGWLGVTVRGRSSRRRSLPSHAGPDGTRRRGVHQRHHWRALRAEWQAGRDARGGRGDRGQQPCRSDHRGGWQADRLRARRVSRLHRSVARSAVDHQCPPCSRDRPVQQSRRLAGRAERVVRPVGEGRSQAPNPAEQPVLRVGHASGPRHSGDRSDPIVCRARGDRFVPHPAAASDGRSRCSPARATRSAATATRTRPGHHVGRRAGRRGNRAGDNPSAGALHRRRDG